MARRVHRRRKRGGRGLVFLLFLALFAAVTFWGDRYQFWPLPPIGSNAPGSFPVPEVSTSAEPVFTLENLPDYAGKPYVELGGNLPHFPEEDKAEEPFEHYSELDGLGRCGAAYAKVGPETMPNEERGAIGMIKPSGWQTVRYDFIDGKYLYNRCHLIGYQLTGENDNEKNLITGTRYLNITGMLPFENQVAGYVERTGNHVLYRATPVFEGEELVARGVELEAYSVEDEGAGVCFHVFVYNVQPGVVINYATGENRAAREEKCRIKES